MCGNRKGRQGHAGRQGGSSWTKDSDVSSRPGSPPRWTPGCGASRRAATSSSGSGRRPACWRCPARCSRPSSARRWRRRRCSSRIPSRRSARRRPLALAASTEGPADGSAFRAVEAAKQFSGVNLNMTYEAGLQALDPRNFSGPLWEQLTGIKSTVVELPVAGHVLEADRRAHRRLRRLRRPRPAAAVDAVAGRRRGDRAARRLHRQVHEHGGPRRLPSALQGAADLQGQDLGLLRRRRHVRPLLSQGHLRGPEAERGLPGEVRQGARSAEDLGGLRAGRAVHHRPDGAERLRRGALPQGRLARQPVRLHAAVPLQRRRLLRRRT